MKTQLHIFHACCPCWQPEQEELYSGLLWAVSLFVPAFSSNTLSEEDLKENQLNLPATWPEGREYIIGTKAHSSALSLYSCRQQLFLYLGHRMNFIFRAWGQTNGDLCRTRLCWSSANSGDPLHAFTPISRAPDSNQRSEHPCWKGGDSSGLLILMMCQSGRWRYHQSGRLAFHPGWLEM